MPTAFATLRMYESRHCCFWARTVSSKRHCPAVSLGVGSQLSLYNVRARGPLLCTLLRLGFKGACAKAPLDKWYSPPMAAKTARAWSSMSGTVCANKRVRKHTIKSANGPEPVKPLYKENKDSYALLSIGIRLYSLTAIAEIGQ